MYGYATQWSGCIDNAMPCLTYGRFLDTCYRYTIHTLSRGYEPNAELVG